MLKIHLLHRAVERLPERGDDGHVGPRPRGGGPAQGAPQGAPAPGPLAHDLLLVVHHLQGGAEAVAVAGEGAHQPGDVGLDVLGQGEHLVPGGGGEPRRGGGVVPGGAVAKGGGGRARGSQRGGGRASGSQGGGGRGGGAYDEKIELKTS